MEAFAGSLPAAREQVVSHLRLSDLTHSRALAVAFRVLDQASVRIGSEQYAVRHATYGMATLLRGARPREQEPRVDGVPGKDGQSRHPAVIRRRARPGGPAVAPTPRPGPASSRVARRQGNPVASVGELGDQRLPARSDERTLHRQDFRTWNATVLMAVELSVANAGRRRVRGPGRRSPKRCSGSRFIWRTPRPSLGLIHRRSRCRTVQRRGGAAAGTGHPSGAGRSAGCAGDGGRGPPVADRPAVQRAPSTALNGGDSPGRWTPDRRRWSCPHLRFASRPPPPVSRRSERLSTITSMTTINTVHLTVAALALAMLPGPARPPPPKRLPPRRAPRCSGSRAPVMLNLRRSARCCGYRAGTARRRGTSASRWPGSPATGDPQRRIGSLLWDAGGPGGASTAMIDSIADRLSPGSASDSTSSPSTRVASALHNLRWPTVPGRGRSDRRWIPLPIGGRCGVPRPGSWLRRIRRASRPTGASPGSWARSTSHATWTGSDAPSVTIS